MSGEPGQESYENQIRRLSAEPAKHKGDRVHKCPNCGHRIALYEKEKG